MHIGRQLFPQGHRKISSRKNEYFIVNIAMNPLLINPLKILIPTDEVITLN